MMVRTRRRARHRRVCLTRSLRKSSIAARFELTTDSGEVATRDRWSRRKVLATDHLNPRRIDGPDRCRPDGSRVSALSRTTTPRRPKGAWRVRRVSGSGTPVTLVVLHPGDQLFSFGWHTAGAGEQIGDDLRG